MIASVSRPPNTARITSAWPGRKSSRPNTSRRVRLRSRLETRTCRKMQAAAQSGVSAQLVFAAQVSDRKVVMLDRLAFVAAAAIVFWQCGGDTPGPTTPTQQSSTPQPNALAPAPSASPQCDAKLWARVYDPTRLRIVDTCRTVTGVITDQHTNEDGDIDVPLALDPPYEN